MKRILIIVPLFLLCIISFSQQGRKAGRKSLNGTYQFFDTVYLQSAAYNSGAGLVHLAIDTVVGSLTYGKIFRNTATGGAGTPGGSAKQVQYNNTSFGGAAGFEYGNTNNNVLIVPQATTDTALVFKGIGSQTAPFLAIRNSSGASLTRITKDGYGFFPVGSTTAPSLNVGTAGFFDFVGSEIGLYTAGAFRASIGNSGIFFSDGAAQILIGSIAFFGTTSKINIKAPSVGTLQIGMESTQQSMTFKGANNAGSDATAFDMTIQSGAGTGNSTSGGSIIFQTPDATGSGTTVQSFTTKFTVGKDGTLTATSLAGTGSRAVLADASGVLSAPVSDRSVKKNIKSINYGLNTIMQLNPVSFEYKDGWKNYGSGTQIGFIAQDIQKVLPNSVFTTPSTGKMGYNETDLIPVLVKAIQEQQKEIAELRRLINKR